jgi:hypothetical protein
MGNHRFITKCDLIPTCEECKLNNKECNVDIPNYIPSESLDKMTSQFRDKYIIK